MRKPFRLTADNRVLWGGYDAIYYFGGRIDKELESRPETWATLSNQSKPRPFPPEPFRFIGIQATRWSLDREDRTGKRNLWLRAMDRLGLGFDS